jgi:hypothetical protein
MLLLLTRLCFHGQLPDRYGRHPGGGFILIADGSKQLLADDGHLRRGVDTDADFIVFNANNGYFDPVVDNDGFVNPPGQDKHGLPAPSPGPGRENGFRPPSLLFPLKDELLSTGAPATAPALFRLAFPATLPGRSSPEQRVPGGISGALHDKLPAQAGGPVDDHWSHQVGRHAPDVAVGDGHYGQDQDVGSGFNLQLSLQAIRDLHFIAGEKEKGVDQQEGYFRIPYGLEPGKGRVFRDGVKEKLSQVFKGRDAVRKGQHFRRIDLYYPKT